MRFLRVELDDETLEALETERRLIGFDSRADYVQWLIDRRGSIAEEPTDGEDLIDAYRDRITELERRLATRTDREAVTGEEGSTVRDGPRSDAARSTQEADGWTQSKSHPSVEVRGSPRTTISRSRPEPDRWEGATETGEEATAEAEGSVPESERQATAASDGDAEAESESTPARSAPESQPESDSTRDRFSEKRVARIRDDPLSEDADVLEAVEIDRLDELSRRAVAKTRSRLNRQVETGLDYRSSTTLADETVRPGEDVVDLESVSVPGHTDDIVAARREVVGRAIAFLRDEEQAHKSDFVEALYETYPAGYETADSWWECLKCALKQIGAIEGGDGCRVWRFTD